MTDPLERQRALMDLVQKLGPGEFAAVADRFRELDHLGDSGGEYDLILRGWAKADPLTALQYVGQFPNSQAGSATILSSWAGNDPAAAEKWALDHHDGEGPNPFMAAVVRGIVGHDVAEASRLAQTMPQSRERAEAVDAITRALFLQGTDAAMAFPDSITDPQLRGGFVAAIAERMVGKDVNKAAAWIAAMDQGEIQNRAARTVADGLAKVDTANAAAWGKQSKRFTAEQLKAGVNIAKEFDANPLVPAFKKVQDAVVKKQTYETHQIKELAHGLEGAADIEATFALTEKTRAPLENAVQTALQPVEHTITITAIKD
ncbi:MAG: hypothetical protein ABI162_18115 [Luteolibacter sp.]